MELRFFREPCFFLPTTEKGKKPSDPGSSGLRDVCKKNCVRSGSAENRGDDPVRREEIAAYGEGGLCLNCRVCTFPNCGFGK